MDPFGSMDPKLGNSGMKSKGMTAIKSVTSFLNCKTLF